MTDDVDFRELAEEKYGDQLDDLTEEQIDRLEKLFEKKLEKYGKERLALTSAIGSFNFEESAGGERETVYTVGVSGPRNFQGPTLFCYGIIDPEDGDPKRIAIIVPESDIKRPLSEIKELFTGGFQEITANISYSVADGYQNAYKGELGAQSEVFETVDEPERSDEEIRELVHEVVPKTKISEVSSGLTELKPDGWPVAFGADYKMIQDATILEAAVSGKGARYVFQDDSFLTASQLPPEVRGSDNEIGLVGFGDPEVMALDTESIVDVFGTIKPNDEGQPMVDIFGYYGHYEQEKEVNTSSSNESSNGSGGSNVSSEAVDERTI